MSSSAADRPAMPAPMIIVSASKPASDLTLEAAKTISIIIIHNFSKVALIKLTVQIESFWCGDLN